VNNDQTQGLLVVSSSFASDADFLSPRRNAEIISFTVCLFFVSVTPSPKMTKFGSRNLVKGFSERDEFWRVDRGVLLYIGDKTCELGCRRGPPGVPK